jgi:hypothetical protein
MVVLMAPLAILFGEWGRWDSILVSAYATLFVAAVGFVRRREWARRLLLGSFAILGVLLCREVAHTLAGAHERIAPGQVLAGVCILLGIVGVSLRTVRDEMRGVKGRAAEQPHAADGRRDGNG